MIKVFSDEDHGNFFTELDNAESNNICCAAP